MSRELVWQLVRHHNSFLVKRGGVAFSREPGNLLNKNSYKYSGFADQAVDIRPAEDRGVVLSLKSKKRSHLRKPAVTYNRITLKKNYRRTARSIATSLKKYRPELRRAALARASAIYRAAKTPAAPKKKKMRGIAKKH